MRKRAAIDAVGVVLLVSLGLLAGCGGSLMGGSDGGGSGPDAEGPAPGPHGGGPAPGPDSGGRAPGPDGGCPAPGPDGGGPSSGAGATCSMHPCVSPTPVIVGGVDTGYDTCQCGPLRRRAVVDCPSALPRAATSCPLPDGGNGGCTSDRDCTSAPNGYCHYSNGGFDFGPYCLCVYNGCVRDSDCGTFNICVCGDPVGHCELASCSSGQVCGPGCDCIEIQVNSTPEFMCETP